uniref:Prolyl endopeptidase-like n=1 Tax=Populus trichocarpa TaxID=3694 RepID=A0A2K1XNN6_POPTR
MAEILRPDKNPVKLDGSDPLLLNGYGSYEIRIESWFYSCSHSWRWGRRWYENGKYLKKKNTYTDFTNRGSVQRKNCALKEGVQGGGLLIGSVLNMRPDLFKVAFAGVSFVDVLTTMLDPTIPFTASECEVSLVSLVKI